MKSILNLLPSECFVLRDGDVKKMPASKLVVGDVVQIKLGNKVPADLRLIQVSNDLKFDLAVLTGESEAIEGSTACTDPNILESKNIALMGTHVVNGNGVGIVVLTGKLLDTTHTDTQHSLTHSTTKYRQQYCHG